MSSVGQALGGIVGGIIGFFVGGPSGALYGAQIGMMAGGAIDPPKGPTINGPRLTDLSVQTSTYGAFIPHDYGTMAHTGNVFWVQANKLIEVITTTTSGGKGGPQTTTNTASYYATFAVGLCEGPIDAVRRIWIGNQLWYDAGSSDVATLIASNQAAQAFTLYLGTDTQMPDPLIQADRGAANVPAYRGLAYIVFDRLPLAAYSNSLLGAQVKVEIVKNGSLVTTLTEQAAVASPAAPYDISIAGDYMVCSGVGYSNVNVYYIKNPTEPQLLSSFYPTEYAPVVAIRSDGLTAVGRFSGFYLYNASGTLLSTNPRYTVCSGFLFSGNILYVAVGALYTLEAWDISNPSAPILLSALTLPTKVCSLVIDPLDSSVMYAIGGPFYPDSYVLTIDISNPETPQLVTSATTYGADSISSILVDGAYLYTTSALDGLTVYQTNGSAAPIYVSRLAYSIAIHEYMALYGDLILIKGQVAGAVVIDKTAPSAPVEIYSDTTSPSIQALQFYDSYFYFRKDSGNIGIYFLAANVVSSSSPTLGDIVQAECLTSKLLTAGDLDVTELTDSVRGYRVTQLGAIRGGIDPLRAAWPFDVVQHGYKIKFARRGSASVATIASTELDARAAGDAPGVQITTVREMDSVLPRRVSVNYVDVIREYDVNQQYAERLNTDAVSEKSVDLPIVFNATEAAQKAETLLYLYWMERYDVSLRLPPTYAQLEPGDVITVTSPSADYELRLTSVNTLPDGRLECAAKFNQAALYTPTAIGEEGKSTGGLLTLDGPCVYSLLDIPLLRDDDDTAGFPVAMSGYLSGWPGGVLYRSDDAGQTWNDLRGFTPGATMGYATTSLSAHDGTVYDFASTLTAKFYSGAPASVTEPQLFAGQNWFAYGADGRWEIIAARTATLQVDGSYLLQDFLRGQQGTEWATGLHAANDHIVLLDTSNIAFVSVNSSTIGAARDYRAITTGKTLDSDSSLAFTYRGVNLECLSPVGLTGNIHPATGDWTLTWIRRSRMPGWYDYVNVPLGEASESYEIDVYSDATYTTVKRTLTAATPTVAYTSAQQVTDFGSNQATLYLKLYQLSATVGRGYALTQSITR